MALLRKNMWTSKTNEVVIFNKATDPRRPVLRTVCRNGSALMNAIEICPTQKRVWSNLCTQRSFLAFVEVAMDARSICQNWFVPIFWRMGSRKLANRVCFKYLKRLFASAPKTSAIFIFSQKRCLKIWFVLGLLRIKPADVKVRSKSIVIFTASK